MTRRHRIGLLGLLLLLFLVMAIRTIATQQPALSSREVQAIADTTRQLRVLVSVRERRVRIVSDSGDTLRSAPVAVGSGRTLRTTERTWTFRTPVGIRSVLSTEVDPVWIRPDWAYIELAKQKKVRLERLSSTAPVDLGDGRTMTVRGREIGIMVDTAFTPWPPEKDIVIKGVLYMPPLGFPHRAQAGVLGRYRLNLGNAIAFHGTLDKASIGKAVTHGCMRLGDEDLEWMYLNVPVGTPVFIY